MAIVLIIAGGIAWWLAHGCVLARIGATGAVLGGLVSLGTLAVALDFDSALRVSATVTIVSGVWLLVWALAGGIRGQRILQAEVAAHDAEPNPARNFTDAPKHAVPAVHQ